MAAGVHQRVNEVKDRTDERLGSCGRKRVKCRPRFAKHLLPVLLVLVSGLPQRSNTRRRPLIYEYAAGGASQCSPTHVAAQHLLASVEGLILFIMLLRLHWVINAFRLAYQIQSVPVILLEWPPASTGFAVSQGPMTTFLYRCSPMSHQLHAPIMNTVLPPKSTMPMKPRKKTCQSHARQYPQSP